jgi:ribosomal-protein-alanine N-acetyltransferase
MGFQKEAYFRENYYYNGDYLDSEIYSLLKTDYQKSKK